MIHWYEIPWDRGSWKTINNLLKREMKKLQYYNNAHYLNLAKEASNYFIYNNEPVALTSTLDFLKKLYHKTPSWMDVDSFGLKKQFDHIVYPDEQDDSGVEFHYFPKDYDGSGIIMLNPDDGSQSTGSHFLPTRALNFAWVYDCIKDGRGYVLPEYSPVKYLMFSNQEWQVDDLNQDEYVLIDIEAETRRCFGEMRAATCLWKKYVWWLRCPEKERYVNWMHQQDERLAWFVDCALYASLYEDDALLLTALLYLIDNGWSQGIAYVDLGDHISWEVDSEHNYWTCLGYSGKDLEGSVEYDNHIRSIWPGFDPNDFWGIEASGTLKEIFEEMNRV